jgi:hypothetical protein
VRKPARPATYTCGPVFSLPGSPLDIRQPSGWQVFFQAVANTWRHLRGGCPNPGLSRRRRPLMAGKRRGTGHGTIRRDAPGIGHRLCPGHGGGPSMDGRAAMESIPRGRSEGFAPTVPHGRCGVMPDIPGQGLPQNGRASATGTMPTDSAPHRPAVPPCRGCRAPLTPACLEGWPAGHPGAAHTPFDCAYSRLRRKGCSGTTEETARSRTSRDPASSPAAQGRVRTVR